MLYAALVVIAFALLVPNVLTGSPTVKPPGLWLVRFWHWRWRGAYDLFVLKKRTPAKYCKAKSTLWPFPRCDVLLFLLVV